MRLGGVYWENFAQAELCLVCEMQRFFKALMRLHHITHALVLVIMVIHTCFNPYMHMTIDLHNTTCRWLVFMSKNQPCAKQQPQAYVCQHHTACITPIRNCNAWSSKANFVPLLKLKIKLCAMTEIVITECCQNCSTWSDLTVPSILPFTISCQKVHTRAWNISQQCHIEICADIHEGKDKGS